MSLRLSKICLAAIVSVLGGPTGPVDAAAAPAVQATRLAVAFPKTYNRLETAVLYGDYIRSLQRCAGVEVVNLRGQPVAERYDSLDLLPEADLVTHLREGRLQLAQFTTGLVPKAIDAGHGEAFAVRGVAAEKRYDTYRLRLIVRDDSPYREPRQLEGARIAHTSVQSNSGNLAPRALFPPIGLVPDKNYQVVYSGSHERSILGVGYGFWKAAAVAGDQFDRMARKGEVRAADYRVLWSSEPFPVEALVLSRRVDPAVAQRVRQCTYDYRFTRRARELLDGADAFVAIDAEAAFQGVRRVLAHKASGP